MVILPGLIKARNTVGCVLKAASKLSQQRRKEGEGEQVRDLQTIFRCADKGADGNIKVPL